MQTEDLFWFPAFFPSNRSNWNGFQRFVIVQHMSTAHCDRVMITCYCMYKEGYQYFGRLLEEWWISVRPLPRHLEIPENLEMSPKLSRVLDN